MSGEWLPGVLRDQPDWTLAACSEIGHDWWIPDKGWAAYAAARRVCMGCPIRDECLDYAMRRREPHGMWGGLTPEELEQLRKAAVR